MQGYVAEKLRVHLDSVENIGFDDALILVKKLHGAAEKRKREGTTTGIKSLDPNNHAAIDEVIWTFLESMGDYIYIYYLFEPIFLRVRTDLVRGHIFDLLELDQWDFDCVSVAFESGIQSTLYTKWGSEESYPLLDIEVWGQISSVAAEHLSKLPTIEP